jgi:hypothetical protein
MLVGVCGSNGAVAGRIKHIDTFVCSGFIIENNLGGRITGMKYYNCYREEQDPEFHC